MVVRLSSARSTPHFFAETRRGCLAFSGLAVEASFATFASSPITPWLPFLRPRKLPTAGIDSKAPPISRRRMHRQARDASCPVALPQRAISLRATNRVSPPYIAAPESSFSTLRCGESSFSARWLRAESSFSTLHCGESSFSTQWLRAESSFSTLHCGATVRLSPLPPLPFGFFFFFISKL